VTLIGRVVEGLDVPPANQPPHTGTSRLSPSLPCSPAETAADVALSLISSAVTAKLATEIGAPRLASRAARQASDTAARLVILLSPIVARVPLDVEAEAVADVRATSDLIALLRPEPDEEAQP
jgi:hypothetical protein